MSHQFYSKTLMAGKSTFRFLLLVLLGQAKSTIKAIGISLSTERKVILHSNTRSCPIKPFALLEQK